MRYHELAVSNSEAKNITSLSWYRRRVLVIYLYLRRKSLNSDL